MQLDAINEENANSINFHEEKSACKKDLETHGHPTWVTEMVKYVGEIANVNFSQGVALSSYDNPRLNPYTHIGGMKSTFKKFFNRVHPDKKEKTPRGQALAELQFDAYTCWYKTNRDNVSNGSYLYALLYCSDRHSSHNHDGWYGPSGKCCFA
jgi:hypothetical protein